MSLLTAEEVTNLYLYGQRTVPSNLVDSKLIRESNDKTLYKTLYSIDVNDYMNGPGRFASAASFEVIEKFFNPKLYPDSYNLEPGTYKKEEMFAKLGLDKDIHRRIVEIRQAFFDDGKDNFVERAYIWNTTAFKLDDRVEFVIDADGYRHIKNFGIVPYSDQKDPNGNIVEDFDFESTSFSSDLAALVLQPGIDPFEIGRTVLISFANERVLVPEFSYTDYVYEKLTKVNSNLLLGAKLASNAPALISQLFESGSTRLLDDQNRPIYYGTLDADNLSEAKLFNIPGISPLPLASPLRPFRSNGVVLIGGKGNDNLTGGSNQDELLGGDDNDTLDGGQGSDTLVGGTGVDDYRIADDGGSDVIIDSDGQGKITLAGIELTGGQRVTSVTTIWRSADNKFTYSKVLNSAGGTDLLVTAADSDAAVRIQSWQTNALGIHLEENTTPPDTIKNIEQYATGVHDLVTGSNASDKIATGRKADVVHGYNGDDILDVGDHSGIPYNGVPAQADNDVVDAGNGNDYVDGGIGNDYLLGGRLSPGTDAQAAAEQDTLIGGDGIDLINGGIGNDVILGGQKDQSLFGADDPLKPGDWLLGGDGDDIVHGSQLRDMLNGGAGEDTINGGSSDDVILGDANYRFTTAFNPAVINGWPELGIPASPAFAAEHRLDENGNDAIQAALGVSVMGSTAFPFNINTTSMSSPLSPRLSPTKRSLSAPPQSLSSSPPP